MFATNGAERSDAPLVFSSPPASAFASVLPAATALLPAAALALPAVFATVAPTATGLALGVLTTELLRWQGGVGSELGELVACRVVEQNEDVRRH